MTARVVVCGTGFGRVYLRALAGADPLAQLTGVLARGSERSAACARRAGVPLYTHPDQLPPDVDLAVVAVYAGVNGGPGSELARQLMARGIHVLQEGPLHRDELAESLRLARRVGVVYQVSTHYVEVAPVRRFVAAARALAARQPLLYADVACGLQVFYHLFDILRLALGGLRPWSFDQPVGRAGGFAVLAGSVHDLPVTVRVQNQLHRTDPDNHAHLLHRVSIGAEGGNLTLVDTHGPVVWSPRPHFPPEGRGVTRLEEAEGATLDYPSTTPLGAADAPTYRQITGELWPAAAGRALAELHRASRAGADPLVSGQVQLAVSEVWQDASRRLGEPDLLDGPSPRPLPVQALQESVRQESVRQESARQTELGVAR